jgi:hypothetical protein
MGKSSGGGGTQQVEQNTSSLPAYAEPYFKDYLARTAYQTALPYESYGGQRMADFNDTELYGMQDIIDIGTSGQNSYLGQAGDVAGQVSQGNPNEYIGTALTQEGYNRMGAETGNLANTYSQRNVNNTYSQPRGIGTGYSASQFDPGQFINQGVAASYMDPYMRNVVDIQKREAGRQSDIMSQGLATRAGEQGSLGGYREAIMQAELDRNTMQQMNDIEQQGLSTSYQQAQGTYNADRDARFGAYSSGEQNRQQQANLYQNAASTNEQNRQASAQMGMDAQRANEQNRQAQSQMGMDAAQGRIALGQGIHQLGMDSQDRYLRSADQRLSASDQLARIAAQDQGMGYERAINTQAVGQNIRDMDQRGMDMGYQDFLRQQEYPAQQLDEYGQALYGLGANPNTTSTTSGTGPSDLTQVLGAGVAGVGLYNAYK